MMDLSVGSVFTPADGGERHRVVWEDGDRIALIVLDRSSGLPRWKPREEVVEDVECGRWLPESSIPSIPVSPSDKAKSVRDERWKAIETIVTASPGAIPPGLDEAVRGQAVADAAKAAGVSRPKMYEWLRRYWSESPSLDGLLGRFDRCGAPGEERIAGEHKRGRPRARTTQGVNVTPQWRRWLVSGARKYFERQKLSFAEAYKRTLRDYQSGALTGKPQVVTPALVPTVGQMRYHYNKARPRSAALLVRLGSEEYGRNHRPILGGRESYADGPGCVFEIDASPADFRLLARQTLATEIGRATLYSVVDVWSSIPVGFFLGFNNNSWLAASRALECAFNDKVEFCARYGITITPEMWPCHHVCSQLMSDHGAEYMGDSAVAAGKGLGFSLLTAPPARGDRKPTVERSIGLINATLAEMPGGIRKQRGRLEPDLRTQAVFDHYSATRLIILEILQQIHRPKRWRSLPLGYPAELGTPSPIDLWNWGISNGRSHLHLMDPDTVRRHLLPTVKGVLTPQGIRVMGLHYAADCLPAEVLFSRATGARRRSVDVGWDPSERGIAYLWGRGGAPIRLRLTPADARYAELTQAEFKAFKLAVEEADDDRWERDFAKDAYVATLKDEVLREANARRDQMLAEAGEITFDERGPARSADTAAALRSQRGTGSKAPLVTPAEYIPPSRYEDVLTVPE
jgi:putative transposase